jgi:hypothetical protein
MTQFHLRARAKSASASRPSCVYSRITAATGVTPISAWLGSRCLSRRRNHPEPNFLQGKEGRVDCRIGTTWSRVSFFVNRFRKLSFMDFKGSGCTSTSLVTVVLHDQ